MIYAQRPDATACAEWDFWNQRMRRYIRRGSKGIALIDTSRRRPVLRYVFDVSDTGRILDENDKEKRPLPRRSSRPCGAPFGTGFGRTRSAVKPWCGSTTRK